MAEVKINKKLSKANARKNVSSLAKQYNVQRAGQGEKFFKTKFDEAVQTFVTVKFSDEKQQVFLRTIDENDEEYHVTTLNELDHDMVQGLPKSVMDTELACVIAPQVPNKAITEDNIKAVEADPRYGKNATSRIRKALQDDNVAYFALVTLDIPEDEE